MVSTGCMKSKLIRPKLLIIWNIGPCHAYIFERKQKQFSFDFQFLTNILTKVSTIVTCSGSELIYVEFETSDSFLAAFNAFNSADFPCKVAKSCLTTIGWWYIYIDTLSTLLKHFLQLDVTIGCFIELTAFVDKTVKYSNFPF